MILKSTKQDVLVAIHVQLFVNLWTIAHQPPLSRQEYWTGFDIPLPKGSSQPRDQTQVFCIADRFFTI